MQQQLEEESISLELDLIRCIVENCSEICGVTPPSPSPRNNNIQIEIKSLQRIVERLIKVCDEVLGERDRGKEKKFPVLESCSIPHAKADVGYRFPLELKTVTKNRLKGDVYPPGFIISGYE